MKRDFNTGSNCDQNFCYYYLHVDGQLIFKNKGFNPECFEDSDFVRTWWKINLDNRADAYRMIIRASTLGANEIRINQLIDEWKIDDVDCEEYLKREGLKYERHGPLWVVSASEEKYAGVSDTLIKATCLFFDILIHA